MKSRYSVTFVHSLMSHVETLYLKTGNTSSNTILLYRKYLDTSTEQQIKKYLNNKYDSPKVTVSLCSFFPQCSNFSILSLTSTERHLAVEKSIKMLKL